MSTLTLEKIMEAALKVRAMPKPPAIDLFGHNLGNDQCYMLKVPVDSEFFRVHGTNRDMVIVPEEKIDRIFRVLRDAGIDVRLKPRLRDEPQYCICVDPENCTEAVPGRICKAGHIWSGNDG